MKLKKITDWLEAALEVDRFDDVSNNGLQIARRGEEVTKVAWAVDASVRSVKTAAKAGAELLIVHHGISWGGGIKRLSGGVYNVVQAAIEANLAVWACHLPLDANHKFGNNYTWARELGLKALKPAFSYHGNVIGVIGKDKNGELVGVCSGGAGEFAEAAQALGCSRFLTGEANWAEVIAAQNIGMKMETYGHYETEVYGVREITRALVRRFPGLKEIKL